MDAEQVALPKVEQDVEELARLEPMVLRVVGPRAADVESKVS